MLKSPETIQAGPFVVDRDCYTDPAIFALEQKHIFTRTWAFVAHESELAEPGDYRTAEVGGQPVIAVRGKDGEIRGFYNSCRHKATMLLTERSGKCEQIRCPYHHWTYDTQGNLKSVPRVEAYGPDFDLDKFGLVEVPRIEQVLGLIFVRLTTDGPDLQSYIADAMPYLEEVALYTGEPLDTLGIYDYLYDGNWKLLMENTVDDYHAEYLHDYAFKQRASVFGMKGNAGFMAEEGSHFSVELGVHGAFDQKDAAETLVVQKDRNRRIYLNIFPSLIALYNPVWDVTALRVILPIAVDKTRVVNYVLAPASADSERRRKIGERFHYSWGPGGRAGVDDIEIFSQIQKGLMAQHGGRVIVSRGHMNPGPVGGPTEDHAVRAFWEGWRTYMADAVALGDEAANRNILEVEHAAS